MTSFVGALIALLARRPALFATSLVLQIGRTAIQFVPGLLIWQLFDRLDEAQTLSSTVWLLVALLVAAAAGRLVILLTAIWFEATCSFSSSSLLRANGLSHLLGRPAAEPLRLSRGDALSRLSADADLIGRFLSFALLTVGDIVLMVGVVVLLASVNSVVTVGVFIPIVAAAVLVNQFGSRLERFRASSRQADARVSEILTESFSSIQAIQVGQAETRIRRRLEELSAVRRRTVLREKLFDEVLMSSLMDNIALISVGSTLVLAAGSLIDGTMSLGQLALFIYFLPVISDSLIHYGYALTVARQSNVAWQRLGELTDTDDDALHRARPLDLRSNREIPVEAVPPLAEPLEQVSINGATALYPGTSHGVHEVSLTIDANTLTVITGRVGAGKSTLLRAMLGLLPLTAGEIRWNGRTVDEPGDWFLPPRCAYTPQVPTLLSISLRDNILLGLGLDDDALQPVLARTALDHDVERLSDRLATTVGRRGSRLSGGQVQRVAAARMLARSPGLLVVDDLSSALDSRTERQVWDRLLDDGATCLAVSHRRAALERADQVAVLAEGRVVFAGSLTNGLDTCDDLAEIWRRDE